MTREIRCPQCGSKSLYRDGIRYLEDESAVQRWLCRSCGYRFSDPNHKKNCNMSDMSQHIQRIQSLNLKTPDALTYSCRVSARRQSGAKNLVKVEPRSENWAAGATTKKPTSADVKGHLAVYAAKQLTMGLKEKTVKARVSVLKLLINRGANLLEPLSAFKTIDKAKKFDRAAKKLTDQEWSDGSKYQAAEAYLKFCEISKIPIPSDINFHKFKTNQKLPWIPLESEIDQLIAGCSPRVTAFLQLLKETGVRCGEAWRLKWTDIDMEHAVVTFNAPEKHGRPRQFKMNGKLTAMLNLLPKTSQKVWGNTKLNYFRQNFMRQRKRVAFKLQNPRIDRISFHTFRHFYATMEYHKTKDLLHVQQRLGHRSILSTMIYTQLVNFESDNYHVKTAKNVKEDEELIAAGFEYVTERDGIKIYRKRK